MNKENPNPTADDRRGVYLSSWRRSGNLIKDQMQKYRENPDRAFYKCIRDILHRINTRGALSFDHLTLHEFAQDVGRRVGAAVPLARCLLESSAGSAITGNTLRALHPLIQGKHEVVCKEYIPKAPVAITEVSEFAFMTDALAGVAYGSLSGKKDSTPILYVVIAY